MQIRDLEVRRNEQGTALIAYLRKALNLSGKAAKRLLDDRAVLVNGQRIWMARHPLVAGDRLRIVEPPNRRTQPAALTVLVRGEGYCVIDKPDGLLAQGRDGVEGLLRKQLNNPSLACVHRLDRDTSGCLLLADDPAIRERLVAAFVSRDVFKLYHAIVHGRIRAETRVIASPIDGQRAVTRIRILDRGTGATHIQAVIETGRTHQIRKHLAAIHHPVAGDRTYAVERAAGEFAMAAPRQLLHAAKLVFPDPRSGQPVRAIAPLPGDFRAMLAACRLT